MIAIKAARKFIQNNPTEPDSKVIAALVLALESESSFSLGELYKLQPDRFNMALDVLKDWRIDRYYVGKAKLFDVSWRVKEISAGEGSKG